MSFSKARLRRFNEEIPQVPSPGRYDPKLDGSVKGAVMPTSKRFPGQAISSSLDNIEKASTAVPVFRTPQLMRKVPLTPRLQYLKEKNMDTSGSDILSSEERSCVKSALKKTVTKADYKRLEDELHSLTDKYHTMLLDKEMEVNILKEELNEIKIHEAELNEILEEKIKHASDRHKEAQQLKGNLETMVEKIKADRDEHQKFISDLKSQILELQNKKYELETVLGEKQSVIVTINDKYSDLENELKSLQEENVILEQANSCILMGAEEKLQEIEGVVNSKLEALLKSYDVKYEEEQMVSQTKMNFFTHEFNLKSKQVIDQVKQSQEKVKELERLIDKKVKEFADDIKEADERCKYLYRELCKVEEQRDELVLSDLDKKLLIIDVQEKSDSYQNELDECKNTCRKYQITLNTMTETVSALSKRLFESEQEVERLNVVEKDLDLQKQLLEEKSQLLLADIVAIRESMDKMEEEIIRDVSALKENLEAKAELFKEEALKTEQALNFIIQEKQCAIDLLLNENEYFKKELENKDVIIKEIKERETKFGESINKLKSEHSRLEEELSEKLSAQKNLYNILNEELKSTNSLVSDLQNLRAQDERQRASLVKQVEQLKTDSMSLERVNAEQHSKIQSLQSEIERVKEVNVKQQKYVDELISDLVLEKERCEAVETEKDRIKEILQIAELNVAEKSEEAEKLLECIESLKQSLKENEDKIKEIEGKKLKLEKQLIVAEHNIVELKTLDPKGKEELERKINDLQCQLSSAKERIKTEIPKLERDNINKAENILELNLCLDSLKEEMDLQNTQISCLGAEKDSLNNVLEESKAKIYELEKTVHNKNLKISALKEEQLRNNELCQDLFSQLDSLSTDYNKQNQEMKLNAENAMKLTEAEERISDLEMQLFEKDKELEMHIQRINNERDLPLLDEVSQLREKLEELQLKYNAAVEERDKLSHEVGDLMGHQNTHQKIKKVSELKQYCMDLKNENELLRLENIRLRSRMENSKKQTENKENENVTVSRKDDKQKLSKTGSAKKKPMSPVVLKPSNH